MSPQCPFCQIAAGELAATVVLEDDISLAFLDHRPLFAGHCLLIPKAHFETMQDISTALTARLFVNAQTLSAAVEDGLGAEGSFVAVNNRVSQSVPHLHIHVVPRTKGDGLKGFFWPRRKYKDAAEMEATRIALRDAVERIQAKAKT